MKVIAKAQRDVHSEVSIMRKLQDHPFFLKLHCAFETVTYT